MDSSKIFENFLTKANGKSKVNWKQVRIQATIAAMQGICSNSAAFATMRNELIAKESIDIADALVKAMKGE